MGIEKHLRAGPVTQEVFDRLPALLTAYEVRTVTGWGAHELAAAVREGRVVAHTRGARPGRGRSYKKYQKVSVARVIGFRV